MKNENETKSRSKSETCYKRAVCCLCTSVYVDERSALYVGVIPVRLGPKSILSMLKN